MREYRETKERVTLGKQKIELKLQLAQLEKEVELQRAKNKALSLNSAAKVEEKQFKNLNKETATHIGIREAEDWFRPIDLAKESQNFKPKIKENYPQYLERENKNCYICGDSSHCARDCEKRFKPKESNDHIHNRINVNTLKIESEKQNSDEFANLQYVNIFVENQPVTALIDSGCQIPVLNSSLIRVQTPSEEIITLSSCFGEQRMVEVKPINISLTQHSTSLSVRMAISPTLTEEFIIHPSVYSEIKELGHAKSDVLLNESESSLGAHAYAYPNVVSVSNVIENSSYDLSNVKNFNTRNDLSSLIKDYKCNKIKSTKLKLSIVREKCSDIVLCKKANGAMKTSSVEFISRSPTPSPMERNYRRFVLLRRIFKPWQWKRRKREIVLNRRPELYRGKYRCVQPKINLLKKTDVRRKGRDLVEGVEWDVCVPARLVVSFKHVVDAAERFCRGGVNLEQLVDDRCNVSFVVTSLFLHEDMFLIGNVLLCRWMPSQQRGMFLMKVKDLRRPLEYLKMWNEFVCQFRLVCDNDPTIILARFSKKRILVTYGYNKMGPQPTLPGFPWMFLE
ncbi:hypothetical protein TNCV_2884071 [Trichonephila clavipes]|nr:hypothetical protein TNCV_2884071 [Trichonephila clavipes]